MKKSLLLVIFIILFITNCTKIAKNSLNEKFLENSNDFNDILTYKYIQYSDILEKYDDHESSKYFAKLAVDSNNRKNNFSLKLDDYLMKENPNTLADIYFLFNCWLYYETNNKNLGEASICKDSFRRLIEMLENKRKSSMNDRTLNDDTNQKRFESEQEEIFFSKFSKYNNIDILFDYDSYKLNNEGVEKISAILKYINTLKCDYRIMIIGHTDRIGKNIYNNTLARRRATTIMNILNKNGIPNNLMNVDSVSSQIPQIITKQQTKLQDNRRVEIIIDTSYGRKDLNPQPITPVK